MSERQLISMGEASAQLRRDPEDDTNQILLFVQMASAIVLDYVTVEEADDWDEDTAPGEVKAATRLILTELYDNRGAASDPLSPSVLALLHRHRDPTLA